MLSTLIVISLCFPIRLCSVSERVREKVCVCERERESVCVWEREKWSIISVILTFATVVLDNWSLFNLVINMSLSYLFVYLSLCIQWCCVVYVWEREEGRETESVCIWRCKLSPTRTQPTDHRPFWVRGIKRSQRSISFPLFYSYSPTLWKLSHHDEDNWHTRSEIHQPKTKRKWG